MPGYRDPNDPAYANGGYTFVNGEWVRNDDAARNTAGGADANMAPGGGKDPFGNQGTAPGQDVARDTDRAGKWLSNEAAPAAQAAPVERPTAPAHAETITLGGGCFWCLEAVFEELKGVVSVTSGYAGGHVANPDYEQVSSGTTGHAEVVQLVFDPQVLPLDVLLHVYFTIHDPTTLDRQGNDVGPQYRSIAFYRDAAQKTAIEKAIAQAGQEYSGRIVTQVEPFTVRLNGSFATSCTVRDPNKNEIVHSGLATHLTGALRLPENALTHSIGYQPQIVAVPVALSAPTPMKLTPTCRARSVPNTNVSVAPEDAEPSTVDGWA